MKKFDVSIIEYLGKVEGGILVLMGIVYENEYYESTFFYNETDILLTVSEELEQIVGDIKKHPAYATILKDILSRVVPFAEMYDRIDPVNFGRWVESLVDITSEMNNSSNQ